ncbi:uncharacterized protein LOC119673289 [Teleopsis dalmanni]|uniref:uncharacterized protein LOC119672373 n=1 Tax=Teleopsis dalmanni TaxID=139649 RepID=UPI0018CFB6F7|nr:uncharacterized protein LOC119672373 [Teleopsis dalmanni]XP_037939327.1 uncharacterized protein LOC119672373 [Teleopsis dalmanni]XP_037939480.1 uncharacterized protein LOC119672494 [Teleopsis dalmanni]XP_037940481.1 uncharacterized protein LOC119673289 [Teleopsis dalmanni]XP_037940483.1 uncharacterized protein LOC119673289 [Teleopsis dalmanni]
MLSEEQILPSSSVVQSPEQGQENVGSMEAKPLGQCKTELKSLTDQSEEDFIDSLSEQEYENKEASNKFQVDLNQPIDGNGVEQFFQSVKQEQKKQGSIKDSVEKVHKDERDYSFGNSIKFCVIFCVAAFVSRVLVTWMHYVDVSSNYNGNNSTCSVNFENN